MRHLKMKILGLMGAILFCASTQVVAEVCEAEIEQTLRDKQADLELNSNPDIFRSVLAISEIRWGKEIAWTKEQYFGKSCATFLNYITQPYPAKMGGSGKVLPSVEQALSYDLSVYLTCNKGARSCSVPGYSVSRSRMELCFLRTRAAQCGSSSASAPPSGTTNTNRPALISEASTNSPEAQRLNAQLNEAVALAQKRQADVDRARQGKPKRHTEGSVAHNCLKPQRGGGVINECPYAVEYVYCVLRPEKDSWSASFDCEKGKFGSWQVGRGPNNRSIMHTAGLTTYWFACRYGETLHKPDGISPADIEFQTGRGLLGRCAEWGSGGK